MESVKQEIVNAKQEIIAKIRQEPNPGEKGVIELEDAEEQPKINDKSQIEISTSVQEQPPVTEIRETKETEKGAAETLRRRGEREDPNVQVMGEGEMAETKLKSGRRQTDPKKMKVKQRLKKGLSKFGACRKKKWELRKKTTQDKSSKEAFQAWLDHVSKKHRNQTNNVRQQTTEMQRHVPWDPGGVVYKIRRKKFPLIEASTIRFLQTRTPPREASQEINCE
jgi:hypothetical protein